MQIRSILLPAALCAVMVAGGCKQQQSSQWGQGQTGQPGQGQQVYNAPPVGKTPDEMRHLEELARNNPKNVNAWIALGNAQMDAQRYADAIIAYQRALDLDPKNVDVRVDMGTCYRGANQPEKALEEYRKALKLNPNHPNANRNSGVVLAYDLHRSSEAVKFFETYLAVTPGAIDTAQIRQTIEELKRMK